MSTSAFISEESMVTSFVEHLTTERAPWIGVHGVCREFDYQRGRTDVVAVTAEGYVVAFEAKLERWREAMHQAYRNRCFADMSFVVLPKDVALIAAGFHGEFQRRGVGICYVDTTDGVVVLTEGVCATPLQPWLRARAAECAAVSAECRSN
jgi:hypothetical protein